MAEVDLSNKNLGAGGAIIVGAWISHKDNGAMKKLTISGDDYRAKPVTMDTSMMEANFSNKFLGVSGAMMLAAFLPKCR